jgi:hypothetical protein
MVGLLEDGSAARAFFLEDSILRRRGVSRSDWRRDICIIGIQVSNWNEARHRATQQQVYLERLHGDFVGIRERSNRCCGRRDQTGTCVQCIGFATSSPTGAGDLRRNGVGRSTEQSPQYDRLLGGNALNSREQRRIQIGPIEEILSLLEIEQ